MLRALACAVALTLPGVPVAAAGVQPNAHGVISSVNGFFLFESPPLWGSQLQSMQQHGVQVVRSDAAWSDIQPQPPSTAGPGWQWSAYDAWVAALASYGLTWQPILDYNTSWAQADGNHTAFAEFAAAVAARYGANGTFWVQHPTVPYLPAQIFEIWNEENVSATTYINPVTYGQLYLTARNAIRALDPSASVDIGGLAEAGTPAASPDQAAGYLGLMLIGNPTLKNNIDAIALHPYAPTAADSVAWVAHFRGSLRFWQLGSKPIDLTEFGWAYAADRESWRAAQLASAGDAFSRSNCQIRIAAPYDWINPSGDDDFGFMEPTGATLRAGGSSWFTGFAQGGSEPTLVTC
jgi:hypothetical protein